ncbi:YkgJ family cysteine cluster protein [Halopseudomonas sp.]|uniref:YkgJ family cysteine cluster protein n=1 Tax=Halopseudomonas sp. TaxID=2901191 RepID=UPI0039E245C1
MICRPDCGACCIAPSITSPIPGMPNGKPAGVACIHLDAQYRCGIFGQSDRPAVCSSFQPNADVCGQTQAQALRIIGWWEAQTA